MNFFKAILELFTRAELIRDQYTGISIKEILGWIKNNEDKELRFYVDGTENFGHQATTINLMKRLIDSTGYDQNIKIIYNNVNPDDKKPAGTPEKLAILLAGLIPKNIETAKVAYGTCQNITFLDYTKCDTLEKQIDFGFTGGADDMSVNYATKLNVKYFLRLQPYLWDDGMESEDDEYFETSRVEQPSNKFYYLPKAYENFLSLAYKFPKDKFATVDDAIWKWYGETQTFDSKLKERVKNIKAIYACYQENKNIQLWPLYGLHQFKAELPTMAMNFVLTAFEAQKSIQKPIVLFSMNKPNDIQIGFETYIPSFAKDLEDKTYKLTKFKEALQGVYEYELEEEHSCSKESLTAFVDQLAKDVKPLIEGGSKITLLIGDKDITEALSLAIKNATKNEVIVALIGPVPVDIYNYFYANCQIPGVFEGQGTSSLVISLGKPFLQLTRDGSNIDSNYPSTLVAKDYSGIANTANKAALQLRDQQYQSYLLTSVPAIPEKYYEEIATIAKFITEAKNSSTVIGKYFTGLGIYYQKDIHDKLMLGLVALDALMLGFVRQRNQFFKQPTDAVLFKLQEDSKLTLEDVYNQLRQNWSNGSVDLFNALPKTYLTAFFSQVTNNNFIITVSKDNIKAEKDGNIITKVTLASGTTNAFEVIDIPVFEVSLTFSAEHGSVVTQVQCAVKQTWGIDGIPWLGLENPGFVMKVNEGGIPVQGGLTGTVKGTDLALQIVYPTQGKTWLIKGGFLKNYPSISTFYQMAGGIDLTQVLPSPISELTGFGLKNVQLMYNQNTLRFDYMAFEMTTESPWTISQTPLFQIRPTVTVSIYNVQDVANRQTKFQVTGAFKIGKGTIIINGGFPNFELYGGLSSGVITLSDLLSLFGGELDLATAVTQFSFAYKPEQKYYQICATLEDDKPLNILNLFTINSLSFNVESRNNLNAVILGGTLTLLPNKEKINISVYAKYGTKTGWTFIGQQTSGIVSVGDLLKEYLGWDTSQKLGIDGLGITIETKTNSYKFTGKTAKPWDITPLNLSVSANVTLGYNGGSQSISLHTQLVSKAEMPVLIIDESKYLLPLLVFDDKDKGPYGKVSAEITWNNIDLVVAYNFAPTVKCFEVTWGYLTGKIEEKLIDNKKHQIATLKFTQATTLGSMIEIMVSWATGSKFSLSAPWNLLDKIPLSNFELVWDFTDNKVKLNLNIGPIELGFATINSIGLGYDNDPNDKNRKRVMVNLDAKFVWGDSIPEWDATKPETTPSPEGSGNKYLDLRLLAMGQHVTFAGFKDAQTVQQAIALMADMPEPKPDTIPSVTFDADSSWLFAADFGLLKIAEKKAGSDVLNLTADPKPQYVLTLQTVFNDPNLYALRIALEGDAAKVFKGLDFQIMYCKLSNELGMYKAEITLPDLMRNISVGAYSIILPVFGIEVYTNGDFKVDIGFPWNENFARSFSVEAIVPPGIPLLGSGGIYFGKIPQVTANVPAATNGLFNPILVMGFGAQVGLGKSIEYGILKAGFSLTVFGILEGLLAKWNPYDGISTGGGSALAIQGEYFFRIQGTFGMIGKIYGSVDFVIIKADVNITVRVFAQITFASYEPIPITVVASVDATASITIDLWLFSITIDFSFSVRIKETFVIGALQDPSKAPWKVGTQSGVGRLSSPLSSRLCDHALTLAMTTLKEVTPDWSRLSKPVTPAPLEGYLAFALTVAGDQAFEKGKQPDKTKQEPCYITSLFIKSVPAATEHDHSGALKAVGEALDSSFETLAKMVTRWAVASIQDKNVTPEEADGLVVAGDDIDALLNFLKGSKEQPVPIPAASIESFLGDQIQLKLSMPSDRQGKENAAFFPMALPLSFERPAYGDSPALSYTFADYNALAPDFIGWLREYFNQLVVQVEQENGDENVTLGKLLEKETSFAEFVFTDYFLLIMRQMLQALRDGLRTFKQPIKVGDKGNDIVGWVNKTGKLYDLKTQFDLYDLFEGNADHKLNAGGGRALTMSHVVYSVVAGDTFISIAAKFAASFDAKTLAENNAENAGILNNGQKITYPGKTDYVINGSMTLNAVAEKAFAVPLDDFLDKSNILSGENLLASFAPLSLPLFGYIVKEGDTLNSVASAYGIDIKTLAMAENGCVADLFAATDSPYLNLIHLPQFQVGELIKEAQRSKVMEHLSGMVSRYYLHGMRLPTEKIKPKKEGMWVKNEQGKLSLPDFAGLFALTGQQFDIPELKAGPLTIAVTRTDTLPGTHDWLTFSGDVKSFSYTISPGDVNYQRVQALRNYATKNALNTGLKSIGSECMVDSDLSMYPLSSSIPCQTTTSIDYPNGGPVAGDAPPRLWYLPDAMRSLPPTEGTGNETCPAFSLQVHRYNEATSTTDSANIQHYGWATSVEFTIKRLPKSDGDTAYNNTYEIMGASGQAAVLLERMVRINIDDSCSLLTLGYTLNSNGSDNALRIATGAGITMGLSQANLSTTTRPPTMMLAETAGGGSEKIKLLNSPSQYIRLLWEASITRAGGFYLYYNEKNVGGLPDIIFNDKGEAKVTLLVMYKSIAPTSPLRAYMNAALIGDPVTSSTGALIAQAVSSLVNHTVAGNETPASIAKKYYSVLLSLVQNNAAMEFSGNAAYTLVNGTYMVSGAAPGGNLQDIATWFAMDAAAIKQANPRITDPIWSSGLPVNTAIRLPRVSRTVGASPGGATLQGIAAYYGSSAAAILGENCEIPGLIKAGQILSVSTGPYSVSGGRNPGVQAIGATRQGLPIMPSSTDSDYAKDYLLYLYTMLGYRVSDNQDFVGSNIGLPLGPKGKSGSKSWDKIRFVKPLSETDRLKYSKGIPYVNLISDGSGHPAPVTNPYQAIGRLLQIEYSWNDIYGNRLVTQLDEGTPIDGKKPTAPILTGYTDALVGLSQWPGMSSYWTVKPSADDLKEFLLVTEVSFDPSPYNKPDKPETGDSDSWQTRATIARVTYEKLLAQLTDPNGIAISFKTGLITELAVVPAEQIGTLASPVYTLIGWLVEISLFLTERENGNALYPEPTKALSLSAKSLKTQLNGEQIFALDFEFVISRTQGIAQDDFAAIPGVRQIATPVPPLTIIKKDGVTVNGSADDKTGLDAFAKNIEDTLSEPGKFTLTVGTGEDRLKADAGGSTASVWGIRLGDNTDNAISFSINEYDKNTKKGTPQIFAPRPVSNKLESKSDITIKDYSNIDDFDLAKNELIGTQKSLNFSDIDLDNWVRQLFTSIDNLLSPEYLSSILVIDNNSSAHPTGITSFAEGFNAQKKALANVAKNLIFRVYKEQESTLIDSAKEALYQQLLDKLSNLYSTKAAVSFSAKVKADVSTASPQLYGNVVFNNAIDENSQVVLTSPKLELKTGDQIPLTFLVEAPALLKSDSASAGILPSLSLDLRFDGSSIEHQIAEVPGIKDYKASTWLRLVRPETVVKLQAGLGEFEVPMFIRAFPATPRMDKQSGVPFVTENASLEELVSWNYSFTYSQDFHYAQDRVYGEIEYNLKVTGFQSLRALADAFIPLAQFVTAKSRLEELLKATVPEISAKTDDQKKINDAAKVLGAFLKMITDVATASESSGFFCNHSISRLSGDSNLKYEFHIEEGEYHIKEGCAWIVKIVSKNAKLPSGLLAGQRPFIDIAGAGITRNEIPDNNTVVGTNWSKGIYAYWYSLDGKPLTGDKAQVIEDRTMAMPGMNILEHQDAKSTVFLKRNEELVKGQPSADEFIYQTPSVSFTNPLLPTIDQLEPFNIADLNKGGVPKPLAVLLSGFFNELFKKSVEKHSNNSDGMPICIFIGKRP